MSKTNEALAAARAKYLEVFGEDPAANLGAAQLAKKIAEAGKAPVEPAQDTPAADPAKTENQEAPVEAAAPVENSQEENKPGETPEDAPAAKDDSLGDGSNEQEENKKPTNQTPITAADLQTTEIEITNGKVTKKYSKFAWDNFLSKAPGKWRVVASTPPEVKGLTK